MYLSMYAHINVLVLDYQNFFRGGILLIIGL